ncbi:MAG: hypothetical protein COB36_03050 [Alphaproteobacteria bacterium]|nr:MAG: hypothetical protein COB36_03050 [Alphaproteobacteria bacterium]
MKNIIAIIIFVVFFPFSADALGYERGHLGCIKSMRMQEHVLKGQYAETTLKFPLAFFGDKYAYNIGLEKKAGRSLSSNIRLSVDIRNMKPACLSEDYGKNGSLPPRFISVRINKSFPEAIHYKFLQNTYKYSEYIKTDKHGFKVYRDIRNANNQKIGIGVRELLVPPDNMFDYPVQIRCSYSSRRPVGEDNKLCIFYTLLGNHIYLEYLFHSSQFPDLSELDRKIKEFVSTLIIKQDVFDENKMVTNTEKTCEGTVSVSLGKVNLNLARTNIFIRPNKVRFHGMDGPKYNCKMETINGIETILFEPYGKKERVIIGNNVMGKTTYQKFSRTTQDSLNNGQYKNLDNGVFVYSTKHIHRYLIPNALLETRNGEPIIIDCHVKPIKDLEKEFDYEVCRTRYIHSSGISVYHSMYRRFLQSHEEVDRVKDIYDQLN